LADSQFGSQCISTPRQKTPRERYLTVLSQSKRRLTRFKGSQRAGWIVLPDTRPSQPTDEGLLQLVNVVASLPTTILTHLEIIRPQPDTSHQILRQEAVDAYVALYYYTALANVLAQGWLPPEAEFDPGNNDFHALISGLIDRCAADFQYVARVLNGVDQTIVQSSRLQHMLQDAIQTWYPNVRFTSQVQEQRRTQKSDSNQ